VVNLFRFKFHTGEVFTLKQNFILLKVGDYWQVFLALTYLFPFTKYRHGHRAASPALSTPILGPEQIS
jgi:hypothetical protein